MSQNQTLLALRGLAQKKHVSPEDSAEFNKFVDDLSYDQMEILVSDRLDMADGLQIISYLFSGLSMKNTSQKKRVKLFEFLLNETHEKDLSPRSVSGILTWLAIEIDKLSSPHLIRVCDMCVDFVAKTTKAQRAGWHELLPKILTVLAVKNEIDHYGTETSGEEYKKQVVSSIHQAKWNSEILTPIAAMFSNIRLSDEEHTKIVSKLCQSIENLGPEELPPLVYQLLILTANQNAMLLFFALKKYYQRIYHLNDSSGMLDTDRAAAGITSDDSDIGVSQKELTESEAMVLYHIEVVAQRSLGCIAELVKCAKASVSCAEALFDPFLLAVFLIVSTVPTYEAQVTDILKKMIVRIVTEEEKRTDSEWLRKILNTYCDIQGIICKLIKSNACELEGVMKGFLGLSMSLLKTNNKTVAHYGRLIACNLVSKHRVVAGGLLDMVTTNIFIAPEITQFTDCLDEVCDSSPMTVVDYPKIINRLLEALPSLPEPAASKVIYALISLLRVSSRLRDNLLMVLRKSLFVHNIATRTLAVSGFLQLLKRMKIKGMHTLSQNSFQAYTCPSIFASQSLVHTQNSNNEGICLEVIQVLKRCFMLQLPVKVSFYTGVNSALLKNPELCIPITEIFLEHFKKFYERDEDKLPPLNFSRAFSIVQDKLTVQEPLGLLVFVVQKIVINSDSVMSGIVDDDEYNGNMTALRQILQSLVVRFSKLTLQNVNLEGDLENRDMAEGQVREETLRQCLNVFQALISYVIFKWDVNSTNEDLKALLSLHKGYTTFEEFAKRMKTKRDDAAKRKTKDSQPAGSTARKGNFQFPDNVMDFDTVFRLLSLMIDEVDWCMDELAEDIKRRPAVLRFSLNAALEMVEAQKTKIKLQKTKTCLNELTKLGKLLFLRHMKRFDEVREFDPEASALGVEAFSEICSLLFTHYKRNRSEFLQEITGKSEDTGLDGLLETVLKSYLKTLSKVLDSDEGEEDDPSYNRLLSSLVLGINILSLELPVSGMCINKTYRWLLDLAETKTLPVVANVKTLMTLLLALLSKAKNEASLHDNIALQLCDLFGTVADTELESGTVKLAMVNEDTKVVIYPLLCTALNGRLDAVDWVVSRIKAEMPLISQPDCSQTDPASRRAVLVRKEKELVTELGLIVSASQWICTAAVPMECAEVACKLLLHVYQSLVAFTKYFSIRGSPAYRDARFGKLVKLAASHLSSQVAEFLLYIESVHIDNDEPSTKAVSVKILRQAKKQIVYIPKLVAELENFSKCVTQLSVKCKDPQLATNMKLTTARDFRLNTKKLEEAMKRGRPSGSEDEEDEPQNEEANESTVNPQTSTQKSTTSQSKPRTAASTARAKTKKSAQASKKRKTV